VPWPAGWTGAGVDRHHPPVQALLLHFAGRRQTGSGGSCTPPPCSAPVNRARMEVVPATARFRPGRLPPPYRPLC